MKSIEQRLIQMADKGRLHHAFFMVGAGDQTHAEKMQTITTLASAVFLKSNPQDQSEKIIQRIEKRYHPDFFQMSQKEKEIKRDQIQELISWIYQAPTESSQKFAVIEYAQRLNNTSSNALLKTLEEPPAHATLILCAPSKDHILQTLRSRMFIIQFADSQNIQDAEKPQWFEPVKQMIEKEKFMPAQVFELSQSMSKDRNDLIHFFAFLEKYLSQSIKFSTTPTEFQKYSQLFDRTLELENQIYKRYGNISLGLDTFFLNWNR